MRCGDIPLFTYFFCLNAIFFQSSLVYNIKLSFLTSMDQNQLAVYGTGCEPKMATPCRLIQIQGGKCTSAKHGPFVYIHICHVDTHMHVNIMRTLTKKKRLWSGTEYLSLNCNDTFLLIAMPFFLQPGDLHCKKDLSNKHFQQHLTRTEE